MNLRVILAMLGCSLFSFLVTNVAAGGDKSARTTVITLAGGGHKEHSGPSFIPIPIPICTGGGGHKSHGGGYGQGHGYGGGMQSRMGWRRR